jgi:predicted MFS family arabinose efflux permease
MKAFLWVLTIFLAAFGGAVLIDTLNSSYVSDAGIKTFVALVMLLLAVAIYARKLHKAVPSTAPKQP